MVDELKLAEAKTKLMAKVLRQLRAGKNGTMLVLPGRDETIVRAAGNIAEAGDLLCQHPERVRHPEVPARSSSPRTLSKA